MTSQRIQTARTQLESGYRVLARERNKLSTKRTNLQSQRKNISRIRSQVRKTPQKRVPFTSRKERFRIKTEKERIEKELRTGEISLKKFEDELRKNEQGLNSYESNLRSTEKKIRDEEDWEKARKIIYKGGNLLNNEKRFGSNSIKTKIKYLLTHGERTSEQIDKGLYPKEYLQKFVPRVQENISVQDLKPETVQLELSKALIGKESLLPLTQIRKDYEILPEVRTAQLRVLKPIQKQIKKPSTKAENFLDRIGRIEIPNIYPFKPRSPTTIGKVTKELGDVGSFLWDSGKRTIERKEVQKVIKNIPVKETIDISKKTISGVGKSLGYISEIPINLSVYVPPTLLGTESKFVKPIKIKKIVKYVGKSLNYVPFISSVPKGIETETNIAKEIQRDLKNVKPIYDRIDERHKKIDKLKEPVITKQLQRLSEEFYKPDTSDERKQRIFNQFERLKKSPEYKQELKDLEFRKKAYVDEQRDYISIQNLGFYTEINQKGEVRFKHKKYGDEILKELRPGYQTKKVRESGVSYFFRKLGRGFERTYTDVAEFGLGQFNPLTPFKTLKHGESYSPSSVLIGKGFKLGAVDIPSYTLPYVREARIYGGTTEKILTGEIPEFSKEEPLEVGIAGLYGGFALATKAPIWLRKAELKALEKAPGYTSGIEITSKGKPKILAITRKTANIDIFGRKIPIAQSRTTALFDVRTISQGKNIGFQIESGKGLLEIQRRGIFGTLKNERVPFTFFGSSTPGVGVTATKGPLHYLIDENLRGVTGKVKLLSRKEPFISTTSDFGGVASQERGITKFMVGKVGKTRLRVKPFPREDMTVLGLSEGNLLLPSGARTHVVLKPEIVGELKKLSPKELTKFLEKLSSGNYKTVIKNGKLSLIKIFPTGKKAQVSLIPQLIPKKEVTYFIPSIPYKPIEPIKNLHLTDLKTTSSTVGGFVGGESLNLVPKIKPIELKLLGFTLGLLPKEKTSTLYSSSFKTLQETKTLQLLEPRLNEKQVEEQKVIQIVTPVQKVSQIQQSIQKVVSLPLTIPFFSTRLITPKGKYIPKPFLPEFDFGFKKKKKPTKKKKKKGRKYKPRPTGFEAALGLPGTKPRKKSFTGFEPLRFI